MILGFTIRGFAQHQDVLTVWKPTSGNFVIFPKIEDLLILLPADIDQVILPTSRVIVTAAIQQVRPSSI